MQRMVVAVLAGALALATGCATAGPAQAPEARHLEGALDGAVYSAKDGSFSVASPYGPGSAEFNELEIKELYGPEDSYVSFTPDHLDVYRVDVSRTHAPRSLGLPLETVAPLLVRVYEDQLEALYGTALVQRRREKAQINGHPAEFWAFTQRIPAPKRDHDRDVTETDYVYIIDGGTAVATLWVEIPEPCPRCGKRAGSDLSVPYARVDRFVHSFRFGTP